MRPFYIENSDKFKDQKETTKIPTRLGQFCEAYSVTIFSIFISNFMS